MAPWHLGALTLALGKRASCPWHLALPGYLAWPSCSPGPLQAGVGLPRTPNPRPLALFHEPSTGAAPVPRQFPPRPRRAPQHRPPSVNYVTYVRNVTIALAFLVPLAFLTPVLGKRAPRPWPSCSSWPSCLASLLPVDRFGPALVCHALPTRVPGSPSSSPAPARPCPAGSRPPAYQALVNTAYKVSQVSPCGWQSCPSWQPSGQYWANARPGLGSLPHLGSLHGPGSLGRFGSLPRLHSPRVAPPRLWGRPAGAYNSLLARAARSPPVFPRLGPRSCGCHATSRSSISSSPSPT
jgi:hypothetical protein